MMASYAQQLVLASHNAGKCQEFGYLFRPFAIELIPQTQFAITSQPETGLTFVENAIAKARYAAQASGLPALADDSGLVVPALNGEPGIYSARYAGSKATDNENIAKLLQALGNNTDRRAFFHCTLALVRYANDPIPILCQANWAGVIAYEKKGEHGFGYDPIFYVAEENKTAGEMEPALKNQLSHRAQALQLLSEYLKHDSPFR